MLELSKGPSSACFERDRRRDRHGTEGTPPDKFTRAHLKGIGFKSSNDFGVVPLLKDLGFLSSEGVPTQRYREYRDKSRSKVVMAEALRDAYGDLFHINEKPTPADRAVIEGKFKSAHNTTDRVAAEQAKTFFALLARADLDAAKRPPKREPVIAKEKQEDERKTPAREKQDNPPVPFAGLRYNVEIHLPATKDVEVFNAIFKSLKEHLLED